MAAFGAAIVFGAVAVPAQAPAVARLSATETVAITAVAEKLRANAEDRRQLTELLGSIEQEVRTAHPGYRFDEATGGLVKAVASPAAGNAQTGNAQTAKPESKRP